MNGIAGGLSAVVGSLLFATLATADPRLVAVPPWPPSAYLPTAPATPRVFPVVTTESPPPAPTAADVVPASSTTDPAQTPVSAEIVSVTPAASQAGADDPELRRLLDKLSALSDVIGGNGQSADVWQSQLEQAGVLFQIAERSKPGEQPNWLRMAVDSYYSAAVQSPTNEIAAVKQLGRLPERIVAAFPRSALASYAALQIVEADYVRAITRDGEHPDQARAVLHDGLLHFVKAYPKAPEAPKAVLDAAEISEALGKIDNARFCYRYLADNFAGQPVARKAGGALRRLGLAGEPMRMELPLLYAPPIGDHAFDLKELRGKLVAVYFWSSATPEAGDDLQTLKDIASKYQDRGLEVVYVNVDDDPEKARTFLDGRLTVGTHVFQRGGLDGPVAERYGIQTLPQMFLIGRDGNVLRQSMQASQLEAEVSGRVAR